MPKPAPTALLRSECLNPRSANATLAEIAENVRAYHSF